MPVHSKFARIDKDAYDTPHDVADVLAKHIDKDVRWIEAAAGAGKLADRLEEKGIRWAWKQDIAPRAAGINVGDGLDLPPDLDRIGIATNPPFLRAEFRRLVLGWLAQGRTVWVLQPAGFLFNQWTARAGLISHIAEIVAVPRPRWFDGTPDKETKDHAWVRYSPYLPQTSVIFHGRDN